MTMDFSPFARGFGIGFGLIVAIGAQNAYVLTRGIFRNHHWVVALICSLIDSSLITVGILGMGRLVEQYPALLTATTVGGALFLFAYGALSFRNMMKADYLRAEGGQVSLGAAIVTTLALSLLNPHVYLDTVILLGSIAIQEQSQHRLAFGVGAVGASFLWFFCLARGGQWMQGWFQTSKAWKILDFIVGGVMWLIAANLIIRLI